MNVNETIKQNLLPEVICDPVPELEVPMNIESENITDVEALQCYRRLGLTKVPNTRLRDLARVGLHMRGVGVTRTMQGQVLVTQMRLDAAIAHLLGLIEKRTAGKNEGKARDVAALAQALGFLAGKLTEAQQFLTRLSPTSERKAVPQSGEPANRPFEIGQTVRPSTVVFANEVTMNGEK